MKGPRATCPAATAFSPPVGPFGIVCGVMARDRAEEGVVSDRTDRGEIVMTTRTDPSPIRAFCTGRYVECPVWQAEKRRIEERRAGLETRAA